MSGAYKVEEQHIYTEVVYYDEDGIEVARDRQHDDRLYDGSAEQAVSPQEIEDFYP